MSDPDLDRMLREYLRREEEDPIRRRLESTANWQMDHERKDTERHAELIRSMDGHAFRLATLEQTAHHLEDAAEATGRHELESLRKQKAAIVGIAWKVAIAIIGGGGVVEVVHRLAGH